MDCCGSDNTASNRRSLGGIPVQFPVKGVHFDRNCCCGGDTNPGYGFVEPITKTAPIVYQAPATKPPTTTTTTTVVKPTTQTVTTVQSVPPKRTSTTEVVYKPPVAPSTTTTTTTNTYEVKPTTYTTTTVESAPVTTQQVNYTTTTYETKPTTNYTTTTYETKPLTTTTYNTTSYQPGSYSHTTYSYENWKPEKTSSERAIAWQSLQDRLPRQKTPEAKLQREALFHKFDTNGTRQLSLSEVDAGCRNILHLDDFTNNLTPIVSNAFHKANNADTEKGSQDYVEFKEFRLMLCYLYDYFHLQTMFDKLDSSNDGKISRTEFRRAIPTIEQWGLKIDDPDATFDKMDTSRSGSLHFDEFASWCTYEKLRLEGDPDKYVQSRSIVTDAPAPSKPPTTETTTYSTYESKPTTYTTSTYDVKPASYTTTTYQTSSNGIYQPTTQSTTYETKPLTTTTYNTTSYQPGSYTMFSYENWKPEKTSSERAIAWQIIQDRLPRQKTQEAKLQREALFRQFDTNGSRQLSLSEVDAGCRNILHLDDFTNNLYPIVSNAFNKANKAGGDQGSSDFVEFLEFRLMLCYLYDYFELQTLFDEIDSSQDGKISRTEFRNAIPIIEKWGLKIDDPDAVFDKIDTSRSGSIHFDEFASWGTYEKLQLEGDPDKQVQRRSLVTSEPSATYESKPTTYTSYQPTTYTSSYETKPATTYTTTSYEPTSYTTTSYQPTSYTTTTYETNTRSTYEPTTYKSDPTTYTTYSYTEWKPEKTKSERLVAWKDIQDRLPRLKTPEQKAQRKALFKEFDTTGARKLTLTQVENGARNVLHLDDFTNNLSPILKLAFDKANGQGGDRGSAEHVEFLEFRLMLCYIYDYFELQVMFDEIDTTNDGKITRSAFKNALPTIEKWGLKIDDADSVFDKIDTSRTGVVDFKEFATWATNEKLDKDGDPDSGLGSRRGSSVDYGALSGGVTTERRISNVDYGMPATTTYTTMPTTTTTYSTQYTTYSSEPSTYQGNTYSFKSTAPRSSSVTTYTMEAKPEKTKSERATAWQNIQDRLPRMKTAEQKALRRELFNKFDVNGTEMLSFSDVERGCRSVLHLDDFTNNLPIILRLAFDKANGAGGDRGSSEFVEFLEFRLMLCYIYDFFSLYVMFDEIGGADGKLSRSEFKNAVPTIEKWGLPVSDPDAAFDKCDTSHSGSLDFFEFAKWATGSKLEMESRRTSI